MLVFGRFELQPERRRLLQDGQPLAIGARAFDVLLALLERRDRIVTKSELMDLAWPGLMVEENNLQVQISALRKVLGQQAIATIPGRGYRFTADWLGEVPSTSAGPSALTAIGVERGLTSRTFVAPTEVRTNLPADLTPLIGREEDLAALATLIDRHRLVSIVGAGGVGKTRVAKALLSALRGRYEHEVCFVDLSSTSLPEAVPSAICAALGVLAAGSDDATEALINAVAPLTILIALDNAEHLVDVVATTVEAILANAPHVRLIVTSQTPLKLAAEHLYRLEPLAMPEGTPNVEVAATYGAVAFFTERAQAADRRFMLTETNVLTVVELCRRLDGLPLAIELAAARASLLGLPKLLASLEQRLQLLTAGSRRAPGRLRTLRAALEWSHGLLGEPEQTLFRRLAVFAGSASLEAVQQVARDEPAGRLDEWAVLEALSTLVEHSLVEVIVDHSADHLAPRYRLLDTPRAYALDRLRATGEEEELHRRHADAMRGVFDRARAGLLSGRLGVEASEQALRPDLENGQVAANWALARDSATALAISAQLCFAMGPTQGESAALLQTMEAVLDALPLTGPIPAALVGEAALECARWTKRRPKQSLARARQALTFFRSAQDSAGCYQALAQIAKKCAQQSDPTAAQESLEEMRKLENPDWPPSVRRFGAEAEYCVCASRDDHEGVQRWLQRQFDLNAAAGANNNQVLVNLACRALTAGRIDESIARGRELIGELAGTRHQYALALTRCNLTAALLAKGSTTEARAVVRDSWPLVERFDMRAAWADLAALLAALEGRPAAAVKLAAYADVAYAATDSVREINEQHSVEQALCLAHAALDVPLGLAGWERLKAEGAALREEDVAALALEAL